VIFVVRGAGERPTGVRVALVRRTPTLLAQDERQVDVFCEGDASAAQRLRDEGLHVVALHDGWYPDDHQGGVAVWGQARFWEVRATPFDVTTKFNSEAYDS
jgi:hypothetical protein